MTIESLSYNVDTSTATSFTLNNQRIYLAHTTATTFTSNAYVDPVAAGYTLVYQGTVTLIPGEWNTIALDTVFDYNGADNLLIYWINESLTAYTPYPEFCYTNQTDRVVYATNNSELPATGNINYLLPNIRLHYFESITEFPYETTFSVFPPTYWDMTGYLQLGAMQQWCFFISHTPIPGAGMKAKPLYDQRRVFSRRTDARLLLVKYYNYNYPSMP
jgi:hypothetical protein